MAVRKWEPSMKDATSLAAFRWFANTVENYSIELYATRPELYPEIEHVLRHTLRHLANLKGINSISAEENGCPDGYIWCNGVCAPSCDGIVEAAEASASPYDKA